mmetsp:Transcript_23197/g.41462  ORF Transcript_23197/g.41462 Transcript_23197/m.41462 type:complete len:727 (-) Transcript_23197:1891-4071(-)|eukprot:CAMPEP_0201633402 /NCGR_PEP_ID=MMETSP0493-20130528/6712_1 /ASSEMBLY_ACC=CAM_ASM_000838 /TAXON_ID=420259 /ORGANISM="Thalassiosira gravida, Strain GMp14c1" /LENGTH=726 /DNA_ID=CAMNT_0048105107 /DNA_START=61 /DNA_END=2244 /DNA_ORIENTATION=+
MSISDIEISKTEISIPLDSDAAAYSKVTLRHVGRIANSLALKITATHGQRYIVQPNIGVISPNSSITIKITLNTRERKQLEDIHNSLGQNALDIDKAALLILSCSVVTSNTDFDLNDDELWSSMPSRKNNEVEIRHYMSGNEVFTFSGKSLGCWSNAFPATVEVRSTLDDINEKFSRSRWEKCFVCICTTLGLGATMITSLGLSCFPLIMGLDSLLYMIMDRGEFVKELQKIDKNSITIMGKVVKRHKMVDDIMDKEEYLVQLEYEETEEDGSVCTSVASYSSDRISHGAKELFEMTRSSTLVPMKMVPNCPSSAIPVFLLEKKLNMSQRWTIFIHPLRVVLGILSYFGLSLLGIIAYPAYIIFPCAVGGVFLLVPSSLLSVRNVLELKTRLVQSEPVSIPTESDVYRHWVSRVLGRSQSRRLKFMLAVVGAFACIVTSPPFFLPLFIFGFWPLTSLSCSSRRRKNLKKMKETPIPGKVHTMRSSLDQGVTSYYGAIRYDVPRHGNVYTLEKEFLNKGFIDDVGKIVDVFVMPEHPRSGHPKKILQNMIQKESFASQFTTFSIISATFCLYFSGHWIIYSSSPDHDENDSMALDVALWVATVVAPILVIPQLLVVGEVDYQREKENIFNGAIVVGLQKGRGDMEVQHGRSVQQLSKAIPIDAEDENTDTPSVQFTPALLGDESNHTIITDLNDGESASTAGRASNRVVHVVHTRDDGDGSVGLQLV